MRRLLLLTLLAVSCGDVPTRPSTIEGCIYKDHDPQGVVSLYYKSIVLFEWREPVVRDTTEYEIDLPVNGRVSTYDVCASTDDQCLPWETRTIQIRSEQ